jgi:Domain of unknown function (DUF6916)
MDDPLDAQFFDAALGEPFQVVGFDDQAIDPEQHTTIVLDAVDRLPTSPGSPRTDPFSLTFLGPPGDHLPQALYTLEHPALGTLTIFLVPIGPDPGAHGRHRYEAVFN